MRHSQVLKCSFCGKRQDKLPGRRIIAGPGVWICSECIGLCVEVLAEEPFERPSVSYNMYVFDRTPPSSDTEIDEIVDLDRDLETPSVAVGPRLRAFFEEMQTRWPSVRSVQGDSPWLTDPELANVAMCSLCVVGSRSWEVRNAISEAASRHGLAFYEPDNDDIDGPY